MAKSRRSAAEPDTYPFLQVLSGGQRPKTQMAMSLVNSQNQLKGHDHDHDYQLRSHRETLPSSEQVRRLFTGVMLVAMAHDGKLPYIDTSCLYVTPTREVASYNAIGTPQTP